MIPSWAKPGAKVVCVDPSFTDMLDVGRVLEASKIYEIRWVGIFEGTPCIRLIGVLRSNEANGVGIVGDPDMPFCLSRFRPAVEQKDDIALFTHLLNTTSEDQIIKEEA